jgi:hypothetical protein
MPAFPATLRVGLKVVHREYPGFPYLLVHHWPAAGWVGYRSDAGLFPIDNVGSMFLNLRDDEIRDVIVRTLWYKLRPGVSDVHGRPPPVPFTAPCFYFNPNGGARLGGSARLGLAGMPPAFDLEFDSARRPYTDVEVPGLASIPLDSPDRDLLALAEVAKAVFA